MKLCPKCGDEHEKPGTFCSRKCANGRVWTEEDKAKKSLALAGKPLRQPRGKTGPRTQAVIDKLTESRRAASKEKFEAGLISERSALRGHLARARGYKCEVCGLFEWLGKEIVLQVDHIDGNAGDNRPVNLRLICPNCHSQTDTFGGANKGFGRGSRGLSGR